MEKKHFWHSCANEKPGGVLDVQHEHMSKALEEKAPERVEVLWFPVSARPPLSLSLLPPHLVNKPTNTVVA